MKADRPTYEQIHKHDLARADFKDVFGGPTREGCFKLSVAGPLDVAVLKRVRQHLDLAIEFFERDDVEVQRSETSDDR